MSNIVSPGWGSRIREHKIDGKFCSKTHPGGRMSSFNWGTRDITSVTCTAIPLKKWNRQFLIHDSNFEEKNLKVSFLNSKIYGFNFC